MRTLVYCWRYVNAVLGREMMKPEFFLIGAQKSGTTSLFEYLAQHHCVHSPLGKEFHYFDQHYRHSRFYYEGWFPFASDAAGDCPNGGRNITGEGSTNYIFDTNAPGRIHSYRPDAKLVAILRNPIDRAFSHYQHEKRKNRETRSFEEAVRDELTWMEEEHKRVLENPEYWSERHYRKSYLLRGHYAEQLRRWSSYFPREQLLIFSSDEFFSDPKSVYEKTVSFLGLPEYPLSDFKAHNAGNYKSPIPEEMRVFMEDYFRPLNRELYDLLGVDYGWQ